MISKNIFMGIIFPYMVGRDKQNNKHVILRLKWHINFLLVLLEFTELYCYPRNTKFNNEMVSSSR